MLVPLIHVLSLCPPLFLWGQMRINMHVFSHVGTHTRKHGLWKQRLGAIISSSFLSCLFSPSSVFNQTLLKKMRRQAEAERMRKNIKHSAEGLTCTFPLCLRPNRKHWINRKQIRLMLFENKTRHRGSRVIQKVAVQWRLTHGDTVQCCQEEAAAAFSWNNYFPRIHKQTLRWNP